ncbi:hypothetical protein H6P81_012249 [Aristolochia fimbriata]|uniref:Uncharacterized protein n=1 Tax=Aristolochia fimbriata TaxID=158543 RepID=A0AAV7ECK3_ARIFI|nr:hypothetical protein H6P81_012249 [Aristolochia fimbriata]
MKGLKGYNPANLGKHLSATSLIALQQASRANSNGARCERWKKNFLSFSCGKAVEDTEIEAVQARIMTRIENVVPALPMKSCVILIKFKI